MTRFVLAGVRALCGTAAEQVKRKMTIEQFISNNRGTNGGKDWPRQLLTDIYYSISTDEIKLSTDGEVSSSKWADVLRRSQTELTPFLSDQGSAVYDYDLFALIWGPCIAAMSVVFEHTDDEQVSASSFAGDATSKRWYCTCQTARCMYYVLRRSLGKMCRV